MTQDFRIRCAVLCWVCVPSLLGCARNDPRRAVSGSVALDGEALPGGVISFRPAAGNNAGTGGAGIEDGRYSVPAEKGLVPGAYEVSVQAFEQSGRMVEDPQFGKVAETVPIRFNESGTLRVTVTEGGDNRFDFRLTRASLKAK